MRSAFRFSHDPARVSFDSHRALIEPLEQRSLLSAIPLLTPPAVPEPIEEGSPSAADLSSTSASASEPNIYIFSTLGPLADGDISPSIFDGTDFGRVNTGASRTQSWIIQNRGSASLTLSGGVQIAGLNAAGFTVAQHPNVATLAPGATTSFSVQFTPSSVGARSATVSLVSNDPIQSTFDFAIQGTGVVEPDIKVYYGQEGTSTSVFDGGGALSSYDGTQFSALGVGYSSTHTWTIGNAGLVDLNLTVGVQTTGPGASDFVVTQQPSATTLAPGATTTFSVQFTPSATGWRDATIALASNDPDENPFDFRIQGIGWAPIPEIAVSWGSMNIVDGDSTPSTVDHTEFGSSQIGGGSSWNFTVTNVGFGTLTFAGDLQIVGPNVEDFQVTTPLGVPSLAPGESRYFSLAFLPTAVGLRTATVSLASNDPDENSFDFAIQGTGLAAAPIIEVRHGPYTTISDGDNSPRTFDGTNFGAAAVPGVLEQTFTVKNLGFAPLTFPGGVRITGADAADFVVAQQLPASIDRGSAEFKVRFVRTTLGTSNARLEIDNNDPAHTTYDFAIAGTVEPNHLPNVGASGPYVLQVGQSLQLDSYSSDVDLGDVWSLSWDINDDGLFGDATGKSPLLTTADLAALGIDNTRPYAGNLAVRAIDSLGGVSTAQSTLTFLATPRVLDASAFVGDSLTRIGDRALVNDWLTDGTVAGTANVRSDYFNNNPWAFFEGRFYFTDYYEIDPPYFAAQLVSVDGTNPAGSPTVVYRDSLEDQLFEPFVADGALWYLTTHPNQYPGFDGYFASKLVDGAPQFVQEVGFPWLLRSYASVSGEGISSSGDYYSNPEDYYNSQFDLAIGSSLLTTRYTESSRVRESESSSWRTIDDQVTVEGTTYFNANEGSSWSYLGDGDRTESQILYRVDRTPTPALTNVAWLSIDDRMIGGVDNYLFLQSGTNLKAWNIATSGFQDLGAFTTIQKDSPLAPVRLGNTLYFWANDGVHGTELWRSDGTPAGTALVADLNPGAGGTTPGKLLAVETGSLGGNLFFWANNGSDGVQLWKTGAAASGAQLVFDVAAGNAGNFPPVMKPIGDRLYFGANNTLYASDGTLTGTVGMPLLAPIGQDWAPIGELNGGLLLTLAAPGIRANLSSRGLFYLPGAINQPPVAHAGGPYTLQEGDSLRLDASLSSDPDVGDVLSFSWDVNGDGTFGDATGVNPTLTWSELNALGISDGPATFNVQVHVTDSAGATADSPTVLLTLDNAAPTASASGTGGYRGETRSFSFSATDASAADAAGLFTYQIDWDGNGTVDQTLTGPASGVSATRAFPASGTTNVGVVAIDKEGGASASFTLPVVTTDYATRPNASNPAKTDLIWGGTPGNDTAYFFYGGAGGAVTIFVQVENGVTVNRIATVPAITGKLTASGYDGNDQLNAQYMLAQRVELFGGVGNDILIGGYLFDLLDGGDGADLLLGGAGASDLGDSLVGGAGRDVLFGNGGGDALNGGGHQDLLVADKLNFGANLPAAAFGIYAEWQSSRTYAQRIANISGTGVGPRANGAYFLQPGTTVLNDGVVDSLMGGTELDWAVMRLAQDLFSDEEPGETKTGT